jgi:hypothetical protein
MCDQATLDLITQVTTNKVAAKETFTAYDVSKAVQKLQQDKQLTFTRHIQIGNEIHNAMSQYLAHNGGEYNRTSLPIASAYAWFYHPIGVDPRIYHNTLITTDHALNPDVAATTSADGVLQPPPAPPE